MMTESTGKVIFKSVMWIAIGAIGVAALFAPSVINRDVIVLGAIIFGAVATVQA